MANWSSDSFYFGKLGNVDGGDPAYWESILQYIRFDPNTQDGAYWGISGIETVGRTINLRGSGRWGTGCILKDECREKLFEGVVIYTSHDGFDDDIILSIFINKELVYRETSKIYSEDFWTEYKGRNAEEEAFFSEFWTELKKNIGREI